MDLAVLYNNLANHIHDRALLLCDQALGIPGLSIDTYIKESLALDGIPITQAEIGFQKNTIELHGRTSMNGQDCEIMVLLSEMGGTVLAKINLLPRGSYLFDSFSSRSFSADKASLSYQFILTGSEPVEFTVTGQIQESLSLLDWIDVLLDGLQYNRLTCSNNGIGAVTLLYGKRPSFGLVETVVGIQSEWELPITSQISIGKLGVEIARYKEDFHLKLRGSIFLHKTAFPILLILQDDSFFAGIDSGNGIAFPSIAELAALCGVPGIDLPENFSSGILLTQLFLTTDTRFKVQSFSLGLQTEYPWNCFGIKEVSLSDVKANVDIIFADPPIFHGKIEGIISIGSFRVRLVGEKDAEQYTFKGELPDEDTITLKGIVATFASMLEIGEIDLPIPPIYLDRVFLSFTTKKHKFTATTFAHVRESTDSSIENMLLNIDASIELESELNHLGNRSFTGKLSGMAQIAGQFFAVEYSFGSGENDSVTATWRGTALTLSSLIQAFGVTNIPEAIDCLHIGCDEIKVTYLLQKKELQCLIKNGQYGGINFILQTSKEKTAFLIRLNCEAELSLSNLPVVGAGLSAFGHPCIHQITLTAASQPFPNYQADSGVSIAGTLEFGSFKQDFLLKIASSSKNTLRIGSASSEMTKWFSIGKSLGVFDFHRLGITYRSGQAGFVLDASLCAPPLQLHFQGLGIGLSLSQPQDLHFYLSGFGIAYQNPQLTIQGDFCKNGSSYDGLINISAKVLSIMAIGSYQQDSIFAYAVLTARIGGPPVFFVTGLAAGFGYNRSLLIPEINEVSNFPFLKAAFGRLDQTGLLEEMKQKIQPSKGHHFIAAGIKFTSFKMIDSFALVTVAFGEHLAIALLGLSEIAIPMEKKGAPPLAYAQLALKATFSPQSGLLAIMAQLTNESYILSKSCKITGGFAFYLWFSGEHAGDFVITLGGYHPSYIKPAHYPTVPRLGFNWDITSHLNFHGSIYFALTPSCMMAGGHISAIYEAGCLKAWFTAGIDILLSWKPFHYDLSAYISLGASFRAYILFGTITFKLELSVALHLWGPDFSGIAKITWFIISFSISFGTSKNVVPAMDWKEFTGSFLPTGTTAPNTAQSKDSISATPTAISLQSGEIDVMQEELEKISIICPTETIFNISNSTPVQQIYINQNKAASDSSISGVLPMGQNTRFKASLMINIKNSSNEPVDAEIVRPIYNNLPPALWGSVKNDNQLLYRLTGVEVRFKKQIEYATLPKSEFLDLRKLTEYEKIRHDYSWSVPKTFLEPVYPSSGTVDIFSDSVMAQEVNDRRTRLLQEFLHDGFEVETSIQLKTLSEDATDLLLEEMRLQALTPDL